MRPLKSRFDALSARVRAFGRNRQHQMTATANNCPFCHTHLDLDETQVSCPVCRRGYHPACWVANGNRCAVLGCPGNREGVVAAAPAVAPPAVAAETIAISTMNTNMTKLQSGLVECPHCHGETVCKVTDNSSCAACLLEAELFAGGMIVICSVCKGKGQVSLAPGMVICPHCRGSTLCTHGLDGRGSCIDCNLFMDAIPAMCSLCRGIGQLSLPSSAQLCRHCNGSTFCRRGAGGQESCQSCLILALEIDATGLMERVHCVRCSVCGGRGYLTG